MYHLIARYPVQNGLHFSLGLNLIKDYIFAHAVEISPERFMTKIIKYVIDFIEPAISKPYHAVVLSFYHTKLTFTKINLRACIIWYVPIFAWLDAI